MGLVKSIVMQDQPFSLHLTVCEVLTKALGVPMLEINGHLCEDAEFSLWAIVKACVSKKSLCQLKKLLADSTNNEWQKRVHQMEKKSKFSQSF